MAKSIRKQLIDIVKESQEIICNENIIREFVKPKYYDRLENLRDKIKSILKEVE